MLVSFALLAEILPDPRNCKNTFIIQCSPHNSNFNIPAKTLNSENLNYQNSI